MLVPHCFTKTNRFMAFKKIPFIVFLILLSTPLLAQQPSTNGQREVQQVVINFFEALSNRNPDDLKKYGTVDITLLENGSVWTIDTLIHKAITLNTAPDFKRTNNFDFIQTTINEKTAWTTYNLKSAMSRSGKKSSVHWLETVIMVKEQKKWKIKVLHSTLIKRS